MTVETVRVGLLGTNCYLVTDEKTDKTLLIDPAYRTPLLESALENKNVQAIVLTHGHFDHVENAGYFREKYQCPVYAAKNAEAYFGSYELFSAGGLVSEKHKIDFTPDKFLTDGEKITLGTVTFDVKVLCGHTRGDLVLYADGNMFCGDLLFYGSVGRTDFPGGNVEELKQSLSELLKYPNDTVVYPGHDEPTTIGRERNENMYIQYFNI